jgi:hypothetical protein
MARIGEKSAAIPVVKGHEAPPDGLVDPGVGTEYTDTVPLSFETEPCKVHASVSLRVQTSSSKFRPLRQPEGSYAVRFSDYTWAIPIWR